MRPRPSSAFGQMINFCFYIKDETSLSNQKSPQITSDFLKHDYRGLQLGLLLV